MSANVQMSSPSDILSESLDSVCAEMLFAKRAGDGLPGAETPDGHDTPMAIGRVKIHDARSVFDRFSLDKHGFAIVKHKASSIDESDPNVLRERYIAEMARFLQDMFQPDRIVSTGLGGVALRSIGDTSFQSAGESEAKTGLIRRYGSNFAHTDYAPVAGPMIAARDSQAQGLEVRPYSRLVIMQMWRPLSTPPQNWPLAFCDASSIALEDLHNGRYTRFTETSRALILRYNPQHRWYYLPEMTPDELFLFVGYDSDSHGRPRAAHATFDNRDKYPDAIPRKSIEARFYLYYD